MRSAARRSGGQSRLCHRRARGSIDRSSLDDGLYSDGESWREADGRDARLYVSVELQSRRGACNAYTVVEVKYMYVYAGDVGTGPNSRTEQNKSERKRRRKAPVKLLSGTSY